MCVESTPATDVSAGWAQLPRFEDPRSKEMRGIARVSIARGSMTRGGDRFFGVVNRRVAGFERVASSWKAIGNGSARMPVPFGRTMRIRTTRGRRAFENFQGDRSFTGGGGVEDIGSRSRRARRMSVSTTAPNISSETVPRT